MQSPRSFVPQFARGISLTIFVGLLIAQIAIGSLTFVDLTSPIIDKPNRTYDEKMTIKWGAYYEFVRFICEQTPEHATILLDTSFNGGAFDRYFFYPRRLFYGGEETWRSQTGIEYVIVNDSYPDFPVTGDKVMLDSKHGIIKVQR